MNSRFWKSVFVITVVAAFANSLLAQPSYKVVTLAGAGGTAGQANSINNRGWVSGANNQAGDATSVATLWLNGLEVPLGTLGGSNSAVAWPVKNNAGLLVGISDTAADNPLGEAFSCWPFYASGAPTRKTCNGFRWMNGVMTPLPPFPGGYNSYATAANSRGQIVGWAENGVHDATCDPAFQVLQFRAVIWRPDGKMQELPPLPGTDDTTSAATAINDKGQVVGISGICDVAVGRFSARHAVLWENGVAMDLGSLGGVAWNTPTAINNQGVVVGFSDLPGDADGTPNYQAFIWTQATGIQKLPLPPGETRAAAFGINDRNEAVGLSRAPGRPYHATLWQSGGVTDLNSVTLPGSPYLIYANDINDSGVLAGEAFDASTGNAPAFEAFPTAISNAATSSARVQDARPQTLPEKVRQQLRQRWGFALDDLSQE